MRTPASRYYGAITPLADCLRSSPERFWEATPEALERPHEYVLYLGCNVLRTVHLAEAIVAVLRALGGGFLPLGGFSHRCGVVPARNWEGGGATGLTRPTPGKVPGGRAQGRPR